jgi:hypothetical protein
MKKEKVAEVVSIIVASVMFLFVMHYFASIAMQNMRDTAMGLTAQRTDNGSEWKNEKEDLRAYYPLEVGNIWEYRITVTDDKPVASKVVNWIDKDKIVYSARVTKAISVPSGKKEFQLVIKVDAKANVQGQFKYQKAFEIKVIKDDLGLYENASKIFWIVDGNDEYKIIELIFFQRDAKFTPDELKALNIEPCSFSIKFIDVMPKMKYSLAVNKKESVAIKKVDFNHVNMGKYFYGGDNSAEDVRKNDFIEISRFERKVGLSYLEQYVNNKLTMKWELVKFCGSTLL